MKKLLNWTVGIVLAAFVMPLALADSFFYGQSHHSYFAGSSGGDSVFSPPVDLKPQRGFGKSLTNSVYTSDRGAVRTYNRAGPAITVTDGYGEIETWTRQGGRHSWGRDW